MGARKQSSRLNKDHMLPTDLLLTCPDCAGVLRVGRKGHKGYMAYICQVGHRFSTRSLMEAKEEQVEQALWAVAAYLIHVEMLYQQMQGELQRVDGAARTELGKRVRQAREHRRMVEQLIKSTCAWHD